MMRREMIACALAAAAASGAFQACSNATDGDTGLPSADAASPGSDGASSGSDGGSGGETAAAEGSSGQDSASASGDSGALGSVVINEISGKGTDWVEVYNAGTAAVDLSGYAVADTEKEAGVPSLSNAVIFPSGTVLSPNAYAIVAQQAADASAAAAPICPDGGQSYCFGCSWGISNKDGENLYVLDPQESVSLQVAYPADVVDSGQTWGRIPNGTGTFQLTAPTPGAANVAP